MGNNISRMKKNEESKKGGKKTKKINTKSQDNVLNLESLQFTTDSCSKSNGDGIIKCDAMNRLLIGLTYYESLTKSDKMEEIVNGQIIFAEFIVSVYCHYLDDVIHLKCKHEDELKEIGRNFEKYHKSNKCDDIALCGLSGRHFNGRRAAKKYKKDNNKEKEKEKESDTLYAFIAETFDNLHFYILHLEDAGMRSYHIKENKDNDDGDIDIDYDHLFDSEFDEIQKIIINKRKKLSMLLQRTNAAKNKYVINGDGNGGKTENDDQHEKDDLYYEMAKSKEITDNEVMQFVLFVMAQQYDSDAVKGDVEVNQYKNSNLLQFVEKNTNINSKQTISQIIKYYVSSNTLKHSSFSTGFSFFYWPYFKEMDKQKMLKYKEQELVWNINDLSGYSVNELYVAPIHNNFKSEIMDYDDDEIDIDQYNELVINKSLQFMQSHKVKAIKPLQSLYDNVEALHFGINKESRLSPYHLIAIILYTDFSKLSTNFSSTFRRMFPSETLESVKKRNQKYYFLSKFLRESIQCFGINGNGEYDPVSDSMINKEQRTLFCGMSCLMLMPCFNLRFSSPNSTSTVLNVAMNFTGDNQGIIIRINNKMYGAGARERFFNVCWISKFSEESERVFVGGRYPLKIQSITNCLTKQNYKKYYHAFYWFDAILNGSLHGKDEVDFKVRDHWIINMLIKCILCETGSFSEREEKEFDEMPNYIKQTFQNFIIQKTQIVINLDYLDTLYNDKNNLLSSLIMEESLIADSKKEIDDISYDSNNCNHNMVKFKTLAMFKNLKKILIYSSDAYNGDKQYSFSLSTFKASILNNDNLKSVEYVIKAYHNIRSGARSWIYNLYLDETSSLRMPSKISSKITKDYAGAKQDTLRMLF